MNHWNEFVVAAAAPAALAAAEVDSLDRNTCDQCPHKLGLRHHCQDHQIAAGFFVLSEKEGLLLRQQQRQRPWRPPVVEQAEVEVAANCYCCTRPCCLPTEQYHVEVLEPENVSLMMLEAKKAKISYLKAKA